MPEIERGSSPSGASGYNALRPPELPARPAGGFRNRSVRTDTAGRHERLWGRPIGEAAPRLAGAGQKAELSARAISVAPSSSERFLPDRRTASGEHTYEPLRVTASPRHIHEQINVRAHTPSADPHRGIAPSESAGEEPHYEFAPQEPPVEEPHYEFAPQEPPVEEPHYEFAPQEPPVEEPHYEFAPQEPPVEEPHYEFGPQSGEHTYQSLQPTESPEHVYQKLTTREPAPPGAARDETARSESVDEEPHYEFGPQSGERTYQSLQPTESPEHVYQKLTTREPAPPEAARDETARSESVDEEPHYEFDPRTQARGERIYENPGAAYETPAPSGLGNLNSLGVYLVNGLESGTIPQELKDDLQTARRLRASNWTRTSAGPQHCCDKLNDAPGGAS